MKIINAAPQSETIENPAISYGQYHEEFGYQPAPASELHAPEVPEIKVNGVLISEKSVLEEMQHHPAENKRAAMIKAAEALIIGEVLKQRAVELELLTEPVEANSVTEANGLKQLLEKEVQYPSASEQECQRFYEANKDKFTTSPLLEIRHILLPASPDDINGRINLKEAAMKLIGILQMDPSSFNELVERHSACPSKEQQGNLGQISKNQTVPEFEKHIFSSDEGLIPYPVETRYGFHIVMIDRKIMGQDLPYEYVKDKVKTYLNDKVQRKATAHYIQSLIEVSEISGFTFDIEQGLMQ